MAGDAAQQYAVAHARPEGYISAFSASDRWIPPELRAWVNSQKSHDTDPNLDCKDRMGEGKILRAKKPPSSGVDGPEGFEILFELGARAQRADEHTFQAEIDAITEQLSFPEEISQEAEAPRREHTIDCCLPIVPYGTWSHSLRFPNYACFSEDRGEWVENEIVVWDRPGAPKDGRVPEDFLRREWKPLPCHVLPASQIGPENFRKADAGSASFRALWHGVLRERALRGEFVVSNGLTYTYVLQDANGNLTGFNLSESRRTLCAPKLPAPGRWIAYLRRFLSGKLFMAVLPIYGYLRCGHSIVDIAEECGIDANTLTQRFRREADKLREAELIPLATGEEPFWPELPFKDVRRGLPHWEVAGGWVVARRVRSGAWQLLHLGTILPPAIVYAHLVQGPLWGTEAREVTIEELVPIIRAGIATRFAAKRKAALESAKKVVRERGLCLWRTRAGIKAEQKRIGEEFDGCDVLFFVKEKSASE
ncbi:MAG TPA: hypothetical protein VK728_00860 [Candidatus Sulfotelmatobacter sp.]|nr:hypothetical protein [Candidatus Sulfotelmatobacter sp.]